MNRHWFELSAEDRPIALAIWTFLLELIFIAVFLLSG